MHKEEESMNALVRRAIATAKLIGGALLVTSALATAASAQTTLRLSTMAEVGSDQLEYVETFAQKVEEATEGRIQIKIYPANQLGDWTEVHEQLMQGAVDMASQSLSTKFDKAMALAWFPYTITDYESAREAYSRGGHVYDVIAEALEKQDIRLLGVYAAGMGGAGFTKPVPNPGDPNAERNLKLRIWPGGETHRVLMERFGFSTAPLPWAELYTGLQTGIVDGLVGGTPEMQYQSLKDVTKVWVQYNDHFEPSWLVASKQRFEALPEEDQKIIADIAHEMTLASMEAMEERDNYYLKALEEAGVEVILLSKEELEAYAKIAREEVWPKIAGEIGEENMQKILDRMAAN